MLTLRPLIVVFMCITISACSAIPRINAVPQRDTARATVEGMHNIRYIVGNPEDMKRLAQDMADTWPRERNWLASQGKNAQTLPPSNLLALSGGGDKGAFGAGFLNGWTASGKRPEFLLVTGISTGALIAPFAFLGPSYDAQLKKFYTESTPKDIIRVRGLLAALTSDAVADTAPLRALLQKYIDQTLLDNIAIEYGKGRELWISTTNLDTGQRVIWNMTKIAASKHPKSLALFQDVMIASAAIPGAFPPIMIDTVLDGKAYQEMHVDGGAISQVFVYPPSIDLAELSRDGNAQRKRNLYVLMNARLDPEWVETERKAISIASRAISSMIHSQGIGDLYRIYLTSQRDGVAFNLTYIPSTFNHPHLEEFDTVFMKKLYAVGEEMGRSAQPWENTPPDYQLQ
jgi:hypothetical protein